MRLVRCVKELETPSAKVIGSVTPAIQSRGGGSLGALTAGRGIVRVGSDMRRRGIQANVLDSHKSSVDAPAVSGNILVTIRVDVTHLATGLVDGLGVGLGLPTGVTSALLSKARSRGARRVGTGLIARVVVRTRVILITVPVVPVIVARGTVVRVGSSEIAIGFALVGRVLIPTVLAKDIHGLVDSIGVLFLAQGMLGLQGSQK